MAVQAIAGRADPSAASGLVIENVHCPHTPVHGVNSSCYLHQTRDQRMAAARYRRRSDAFGAVEGFEFPNIPWSPVYNMEVNAFRNDRRLHLELVALAVVSERYLMGRSTAWDRACDEMRRPWIEAAAELDPEVDDVTKIEEKLRRVEQIRWAVEVQAQIAVPPEYLDDYYEREAFLRSATNSQTASSTQPTMERCSYRLPQRERRNHQ